jgi:hypothetical protein
MLTVGGGCIGSEAKVEIERLRQGVGPSLALDDRWSPSPRRPRATSRAPSSIDRESARILRELNCRAHYRWVARLFEFQDNLWNAGDSLIEDVGTSGLVREIVITLDEDELVFEVSIDAEALAVIASGSITTRDRYAVRHPGSPRGLRSRGIRGPDLAVETTEQTELDLADFGPGWFEIEVIRDVDLA